MRALPLKWPLTSCLRLWVAASSQNQSMSHLGWCVTRITWSSGPMRSSAILAKYLRYDNSKRPSNFAKQDVAIFWIWQCIANPIWPDQDFQKHVAIPLKIYFWNRAKIWTDTCTSPSSQDKLLLPGQIVHPNLKDHDEDIISGHYIKSWKGSMSDWHSAQRDNLKAGVF